MKAIIESTQEAIVVSPLQEGVWPGPTVRATAC